MLKENSDELREKSPLSQTYSKENSSNDLQDRTNVPAIDGHFRMFLLIKPRQGKE